MLSNRNFSAELYRSATEDHTPFTGVKWESFLRLSEMVCDYFSLGELSNDNLRTLMLIVAYYYGSMI